MNAWTLTGLGLNAAVVWMALVWVVCRRLNNATYAAAAWIYGFAILAGLYAAFGSGAPLRKTVLCVMVVLWSLRLGSQMLVSVIRQHPKELGVCAALREQFPKRPWLMFFGYFQFQAALLALLSTSVAVACTNPAPTLQGWEWVAIGVWLAALAGSALARHQFRRFHSDPGHKNQECRAGLWRYSWRPAHHFDAVAWIAFFLFALGSPNGWMTLYCPIVMLFLLFTFTSISAPHTR